MRWTLNPPTSEPNARRWAPGPIGRRAGAAVLTVLLAGAVAPPPPPARSSGPALTPADPPQAAAPLPPALPQARPERPQRRLEPREVDYLEFALAKIRKMKGNMGWIGSQPMGAGALCAAALASQIPARSDELRAEVARSVTAALDACVEKWGRNECARAELPLQRVALQYPESLPPDLLKRLKEEVGRGLRPPGQALIDRPWSFPDTENQRMIATARALVAEVVGGRSDGAEARTWGEFATAFLKAHDRDGWYEAESPGYLVLSITSLLHLADLAPQAEVRQLARQQLDVLFATWALRQVGGFPAGPKSRTYSFWALTDRGSAWKAWNWLLTGSGDAATINFMDRPELAVSLYRVPGPVIELLRDRRTLPPYELVERRKIVPEKRRRLDTALYTWATPDYILGVAQSLSNLALRVSGGQEIVATLFPEGDGFAPLYLWSRTRDPHDDEDADWSTNDQAAGYRNAVVARLGTAGLDLGHVYLAPQWTKPEAVNPDVIVAARGETFVALVTAGGWELAPAIERFPRYYGRGKQGARDQAGSWVAVPRSQPAKVGLIVGRRAEDGDFESWKKKVNALRLAVPGEEIRMDGPGVKLRFRPGLSLVANGKAVDGTGYPRLGSPFLRRTDKGAWELEVKGKRTAL